jgi:hypothetical protein
MGDGSAPPQDPRDRREDSEITVLRLTYEELQRENIRLRDARASLTGQLGPLPISAAIVAGLVSGFSVSGNASLNKPLVIIALVLFALMVLVSVGYSQLIPYRKLRDERRPMAGEGLADGSRPDRSGEHEWYVAMIALERAIRAGSSAAAPLPAAANRQQGQADGDADGEGGTDFSAKARSAAGLVWPVSPDNLEAAYDVEWRGVFITKLLFMLVVVLLILARIV